jgi:hypothetical protein
MAATAITKPWKKKTNKIIPQIIKVTHAASRITIVKIQNRCDTGDGM